MNGFGHLRNFQIYGRNEGDNIWLIKTYSADVGYNVISSERTRADGELVRQQNLKYQSVRGVYIPSRTTYKTFDLSDGSLQYHKERIFKNVRLNTAIPAETFTYKNLGLEEGDKFIDKIQGKDYIYQDGKLIPASSGSSHMLKQTNPIKNLNKHCKHCSHKWERLIILASRWLES